MSVRDKRIRVLIVDDSTFMRKALTRMLSSDPQIDVVGGARDGMDAIEQLCTLAPDVITLDVCMPRLDGISTLKHIMATQPCPVIMVSSVTAEGGSTTLSALDAGAVDFIDKSTCHMLMEVAELRVDLIEKVKIAAGVNMRTVLAQPKPALPLVPSQVKSGRNDLERAPVAICLAASTGGPMALQHILAGLPADFPGTILITQHMTVGFTQSFSQRLNALCPLEVREAREDSPMVPGRVLVGPSGYQMTIRATSTGHAVALSRDDMGHAHRPAADVLMCSVAQNWPRPAMGVILTGMGRDGTAGAAAMRERGWPVLAQDAASCVVYGMPKAATQAGFVSRVVPLDDMAEIIRTWDFAVEA